MRDFVAAYLEAKHPVMISREAKNVYLDGSRSGKGFIKNEAQMEIAAPLPMVVVQPPRIEPLTRDAMVFVMQPFRKDGGRALDQEDYQHAPLYTFLVDELGQELFKALTWHDLADMHFSIAQSLLFSRQHVDQIVANAKGELAPPQQAAKADLPPRTAATIYVEYKAMAETIASLANRQAKDRGELAAIVIDECDKAGNPMPVEQRTVKARIEKA